MKKRMIKKLLEKKGWTPTVLHWEPCFGQGEGGWHIEFKPIGNDDIHWQADYPELRQIEPEANGSIYGRLLVADKYDTVAILIEKMPNLN
jgi:hypothetical protein